MSDVLKSLQLLFDRPSEPLFMPKGDEGAVFEVPPDFLANRYADIGVELGNRFGGTETKIPLKNVAGIDLSIAQELPRQAEFSLLIPKHQRIAKALIDIFMAVPSNQLQDFLSTAAHCRDKVNVQLFNYCLSVALLHRPDTRNVPLPNFMETFPAKFVDQQVFSAAREVSAIVPNELRTTPIVIPKDFSASDLEEEHRIAYFREDIGVNLHHWHWHLVYPFSSATRAIVDKNRRGELFYYMHQQLLARYNAERFSNMLPRVKRFNNFREPIKEGYFPKLDSLTSGRSWMARAANMSWSDVTRSVDEINVGVADIELHRTRLETAISSGIIQMPDGTTKPLDIDSLGNMIEASDLSPNPNFYGNFHNFGHLLTAYIHDPDHRHLELFSVMADEATTMRDPFFYRWHAVIDNLFQKFKSSPLVPPYSRALLNNPNITVKSVQVTGGGSANQLNTFWMQSDVDLSRGLDFSQRGPVLVRFTHLNHADFTYNIVVNNSGPAKMGTVRIFMGPKADERGLPWQLAEQRSMMIEMDRFTTQLRSGQNKITRRSTDSSVTIPFERTFRNLRDNPRDETQASLNFNFCGCGWPQHMLIPKGTAAGAAYDLFVMVSNYDLDNVNQNTSGIPCADASSFCGIRDSLYPDKRAMGYPFDRPPRGEIGTLQDFLQPNMAVQNITIKFTERTIQNPRNPSSTAN